MGAASKSVGRAGPLQSIRVVELGGIGPGPFAGMLLADIGADVIQVLRPGSSEVASERNLLHRGRRSIVVDLRHEEGAETVLRLMERADALIEGFRPGVAERLGVGPDEVLGRNPRAVYGRMTGWGQTGPLATAAGHDINYISLTGALAAIGPAGGAPVVPLNLLGDFGGGGMLLAFGICAALLETAVSGAGQVIDVAMVDGASLLMTAFHGLRALGWWSSERGSNLLDGGAPYYAVYETADGGFVAVGALESEFYEELTTRLGLEPKVMPDRSDPRAWEQLRQLLGEVFRTKSREEWCQLLEGTDACFAPVLSLDEVPLHPHNVARESFLDVGGVVQPSPAPRFQRTPGRIACPPPYAGQHTDEILTEAGFSEREILRLRESKVVR